MLPRLPERLRPERLVPDRLGPERSPAERFRNALAPVTGFVAAALALCCLVTLPDVVGQRTLFALTPAVAGWGALSCCVAVGAALLSLAGRLAVGSAGVLALGTVAALLGLALSADVHSGAELAIALISLAIAVGSLLAGGVCLLGEVPMGTVPRALAGWLLPLTAGWGALAWAAAARRASGGVGVAVHPPGWLVGCAVIVLLAWVVTSVVAQPPHRAVPGGAGQEGPRTADWTTAWTALVGLVAALACVAMLLGFQPGIPALWSRPLVILAAAVGVIAMIGCAWLLPSGAQRAPYLTVTTAALVGPGTVQLMLLGTDRAGRSLPAWVPIALAVAGVLGCVAGWRRARSAQTAGLVVMALGAAGAWAMPTAPALLMLAAGPFTLGLAAALSGAVRQAAADPAAFRYLTISGLVAVLMGILAAAPVAWSLGTQLGGQSAATPPSVQAGARVLLGLAFALLVLASATVATLRPVPVLSGQ